ncbi:MAG: MarR family transcriptional regulator [Sarcina sp.]
MSKDEEVIKEFRNLFNKMASLNKQKMEVVLKDYKPSEIHCIEFIGENVDSNVTKLAEAFYMTRGAISKLSKKLIEKNYIESYQKADNKKEVYFRLTKQGKEIYTTHEKLHKEFHERDKSVFNQVKDAEFDSMLRFIANYNKHLDKEIHKANINEV